MKLSKSKFAEIVKRAESGEFVSSLVMRAMPSATESETDAEINRVYDAMEYSEDVR